MITTFNNGSAMFATKRAIGPRIATHVNVRWKIRTMLRWNSAVYPNYTYTTTPNAVVSNSSSTATAGTTGTTRMERGSVNYYTGSCQHGYKFRFQNSRGKLQQCCSFNTGNYNGNFNYIDGNSRYDSTCNIAGSSTTSNVNFTITADDGASSHFIENQPVSYTHLTLPTKA